MRSRIPHGGSAMRVSQQQRLGQHIAMTPQLVQSIRLLQLSALELEQEIRQMLEANVMLESAEEPAGDEAKETSEEAQDTDDGESDDEFDVASDDDDSPASSANDTRDTVAAPNGVSLQARALAQLALTVHDVREAQLVLAIVEAIDDNGYLECPLAEIGSAITPAPTGAELETALARVQQLDPAGYGARDLRECLLLQLIALPVRTTARVLAMAIVGTALEMATPDQVDALAARFEVEACAIEEALRLIRSLNPHPGRAPNDVAEAIVPDLVLRVRGKQCVVDLNSRSVPGIRVNRVYEKLLSGCGAGADALRTQLNEARWLVRDGVEASGAAVRAIVRRLIEAESPASPLCDGTIAALLSRQGIGVARRTVAKYREAMKIAPAKERRAAAPLRKAS